MEKISSVLKEYSAIESGCFFDASGLDIIDMRSFQIGNYEILISVLSEEGIFITGNKKIIYEIVDKINLIIPENSTNVDRP